jgi:hypothetical protein
MATPRLRNWTSYQADGTIVDSICSTDSAVPLPTIWSRTTLSIKSFLFCWSEMWGSSQWWCCCSLGSLWMNWSKVSIPTYIILSPSCHHVTMGSSTASWLEQHGEHNHHLHSHQPQFEEYPHEMKLMICIMILDWSQHTFWISHPSSGFLSIEMKVGRPTVNQFPPRQCH